MRGLLANPHARLLLVGQTCSMFGDTALFLVMGIWIKSLTGSSAAAGLVFFALGLPNLVSPVGGYLVDRAHRRPILIGTNLSIGLVVLLLLLVHTSADVWIIYGVAVVYGASMVILGSAQSAFLTIILPPELLADGNGALQTVRQGLRLVAPLAGAAMFAGLGGGFAAVVDAATFFIAAGCLWRIRVVEPPPHPARRHWAAEMIAGAVHVAETRPLRRMVAAVAVALLVIGFMETAIFGVVGEGLHRPPSFLGVLSSIQGLGAVVGGLSAARVLRRAGDGRLVAAGMALVAGGVALLTAGVLPVVMAGIILAGAGIPWIIIGFATAVQTRTPARLQGRVYSATDTLLGGPQVLSIALGAALSTVLDYRVLMMAVTLVTGAAAAYLLTRTPVLLEVGRTAEPVEG
ncbi:MAG: MFS transporter [Candidatus Dormibacterales bacterium]